MTCLYLLSQKHPFWINIHATNELKWIMWICVILMGCALRCYTKYSNIDIYPMISNIFEQVENAKMFASFMFTVFKPTHSIVVWNKFCCCCCCCCYRSFPKHTWSISLTFHFSSSISTVVVAVYVLSFVWNS